jgi:hypothetical protein
MAKDYLENLDADIKAIRDHYKFYVDAGDPHAVAAQKAVTIVARSRWRVKSLIGHIKHGRCGGNADQSAQILQDAISGLGD